MTAAEAGTFELGIVYHTKHRIVHGPFQCFDGVGGCCTSHLALPKHYEHLGELRSGFVVSYEKRMAHHSCSYYANDTVSKSFIVIQEFQ